MEKVQIQGSGQNFSARLHGKRRKRIKAVQLNTQKTDSAVVVNLRDDKY